MELISRINKYLQYQNCIQRIWISPVGKWIWFVSQNHTNRALFIWWYWEGHASLETKLNGDKSRSIVHQRYLEQFARMGPLYALVPDQLWWRHGWRRRHRWPRHRREAQPWRWRHGQAGWVAPRLRRRRQRPSLAASSPEQDGPELGREGGSYS